MAGRARADGDRRAADITRREEVARLNVERRKEADRQRDVQRKRVNAEADRHREAIRWGPRVPPAHCGALDQAGCPRK